MDQPSCLPSTSSGSADELSKALSGISISDHNQPFLRDHHQYGDVNLLEDLITDEHTFPRCEYKSRFKGTSAFRMQDSDHWGTYYRSTFFGGNCDRIAKKFTNSKTYANPNINKGSKNNAKTGAFKSPWDLPGYKKIFHLKPLSQNTMHNTTAELYDQLLEYRKSICLEIVKQFEMLTHGIEEENIKIRVYYQNNYPCVLVKIKDISSMKSEQSSLYKIVVAYFTAITNKIAYEKGVPIEIVNRASFGHNIPSVAETSESFRINTGIVPKIYADVLTESLMSLNNDFLLPLFKHDGNFKLNSDMYREHNRQIEEYNSGKMRKKLKKDPKPVDSWSENDNLIDILCKVGNSVGQKVSVEITRKDKYIDLITDYVQEELAKSEVQHDLSQPLRTILEKLDYTGENVTLESDNYNTNLISFSDRKHPEIDIDDEFWTVIEKISLVFENLKTYRLLVNHINGKNIVGLYAALERANLEFVSNSSVLDSNDGYGSDSDCEGYIPSERNYYGSITFYSKKITLSTGMRAINLAHFLSVYITNTEKVKPQYMYYEAIDAINAVKNVRKELNLEKYTLEEKKIMYFDLTHCASKGPGPMVLKVFENQITDEVEVIVFDYTSATSQVIWEAITKFIPMVRVLLLVNSGLKNEQIGADMNPYGTIRIITKDENELNELYLGLRCALGEIDELPEELHNIRKAYKAAGAAVTSAGIYKGIHCEIKSSAEFDFKTEGFLERFRKIIELYNEWNDCGNCLNNLNKIHGQDMAEVVDWSEEKIKFLGSAEIIDLLDTSNISFGDIHDAYDEDAEETVNVIDDITDENVCVFDEMSFGDVLEEYIKFENERYTARHHYPMTVLDNLADGYKMRTIYKYKRTMLYRHASALENRLSDSD